MYPGCEKARHSSTPSLPSTASAPASTAPPDWLFGLHQKPAEGADDLLLLVVVLLLRGRCRRRLHRPERPLHLRATLPLHHVCTAMKPSPSKPHGEFRRKTKNKTRAWFNFVLAPPRVEGVCGRQVAHALYHGPAQNAPNSAPRPDGDSRVSICCPWSSLLPSIRGMILSDHELWAAVYIHSN